MKSNLGESAASNEKQTWEVLNIMKQTHLNNSPCGSQLTLFDLETNLLVNKETCFLKDVRANCFCTSLLRMQINVPRHASSVCTKY